MNKKRKTKTTTSIILSIYLLVMIAYNNIGHVNT